MRLLLSLLVLVVQLRMVVLLYLNLDRLLHRLLHRLLLQLFLWLFLWLLLQKLLLILQQLADELHLDRVAMVAVAAACTGG